MLTFKDALRVVKCFVLVVVVFRVVEVLGIVEDGEVAVDIIADVAFVVVVFMMYD